MNFEVSDLMKSTNLLELTDAVCTSSADKIYQPKLIILGLPTDFTKL